MRKLILLALITFSTVAFADPVYIDLRGKRSYEKDHIEGHHNFKMSELREKVTSLYPDKNTEIKLYCRSGVRAGVAVNDLTVAGYTNVVSLGGINDVKASMGIEVPPKKNRSFFLFSKN